MFLELLFSELRGLSKQTALLESLDWSEEKLESVLKVCSESILELEKEDVTNLSIQSLRDQIQNKLSDVVNENQMTAVLSLVNNIIEQGLKEVMDDGN